MYDPTQSLGLFKNMLAVVFNLAPEKVRVSAHYLYADGSALVQTAAHEMGMGTATVQTQHAADRLGLLVEENR